MVAHGFELSDPCAKQRTIEPSQGRYVRPKLITKSFDYRALKQEREAKEGQELQGNMIILPRMFNFLNNNIWFMISKFVFISKVGGYCLRKILPRGL